VHNCSGRVRERTTRLISLKQLWGYDASLPSALEKELEQDIAIDQTAEVFVHDRLAERGKIRFGLLKEVWGDDGGGIPGTSGPPCGASGAECRDYRSTITGYSSSLRSALRGHLMERLRRREKSCNIIGMQHYWGRFRV
jgi:hypothetical protein